MTDQQLWFSRIEDVAARRTQQGAAYLEFLRVPSMSLGLYVLAAGSADPQAPHEQDEAYLVLQGKARMRVAAEDRAVDAGSLIFVAAHVEHRFYDIEEELSVLVFFAPAESA